MVLFSLVWSVCPLPVNEPLRMAHPTACTSYCSQRGGDSAALGRIAAPPPAPLPGIWFPASFLARRFTNVRRSHLLICFFLFFFLFSSFFASSALSPLVGPFYFTSTETRLLIRDGGGGGGGGEEGERVKARPRILPEKDRRERGPPPEQWKC